METARLLAEALRERIDVRRRLVDRAGRRRVDEAPAAGEAASSRLTVVPTFSRTATAGSSASAGVRHPGQVENDIDAGRELAGLDRARVDRQRVEGVRAGPRGAAGRRSAVIA
jgi:hypothetical protein